MSGREQWQGYHGGRMPVPPETWVDLSFGPDDVDMDVQAGRDWESLLKGGAGRAGLTAWRYTILRPDPRIGCSAHGWHNSDCRACVSIAEQAVHHD